MTESKLYDFIAESLNMQRTDIYASGIRMNGNNVAEARGVAADYTTGRRIEWYFDGETVTDTNSGETFTAEADETETNKQEEGTMKNYDYMNAVCDDVREYIENEIDAADWTGDREGLEEKLNDDLFVDDSVTGNASGSYFCNAYRAKEAFMSDPKAEDYFAECCTDFGMDAAEVGKHFIRGDYEYFDVTIRCYLLGQAISEVLNELEETGYFDEVNPDEIAF